MRVSVNLCTVVTSLPLNQLSLYLLSHSHQNTTVFIWHKSRVRIWRARQHTPTTNSQEYPSPSNAVSAKHDLQCAEGQPSSSLLQRHPKECMVSRQSYQSTSQQWQNGAKGGFSNIVQGGSMRHYKRPITDTILLKSVNQWTHLDHWHFLLYFLFNFNEYFSQ